eukprot:15965905-Heterocapsa_arctica.AAC.1
MPSVLADVIHTHVAGLRLNSVEFPLKELAVFQLAPGSRAQFLIVNLIADHYLWPTQSYGHVASGLRRWTTCGCTILAQSFRLTNSAGSIYVNSPQGSSVLLRTCTVAAHFGAAYSYA